MSNYDNIRPYAEMSHKAKLAGGPEIYIQRTYDAGCKACKLITNRDTSRKVMLAAGAGAVISIGAWELGKFVCRKVSELIDRSPEPKYRRILIQNKVTSHQAASAKTVAVPASAAKKPETTMNIAEETASNSPMDTCETAHNDAKPQWFEKMHEAMELLKKEDA